MNEQNKLVIELACAHLRVNGFKNVFCNRDHGRFPDTYATATDGTTGTEYLIAITGRNEAKEDGRENNCFNLIDAEKVSAAEELIKRANKTFAFVAVALNKTTSSYAVYFDKLESIRLSIPMLQTDRKYRCLFYAPDTRIKDL